MSATRGEVNFADESQYSLLVQNPSLPARYRSAMTSAVEHAKLRTGDGHGRSNDDMVKVVNVMCDLKLTPVTMVRNEELPIWAVQLNRLAGAAGSDCDASGGGVVWLRAVTGSAEPLRQMRSSARLLMKIFRCLVPPVTIDVDPSVQLRMLPVRPGPPGAEGR